MKTFRSFLFAALLSALLPFASSAQCPDGQQSVVLHLESNTNNNGPVFAQWHISTLGGDIFNQGMCQFGPNSGQCSASLCLTPGCYEFLLTSGSTMEPWLAAFGASVTVNGQTVPLLFQEYGTAGNNFTYSFAFGVGQSCVDCSINVQTMQLNGNILVLQATDVAPGAQVHWTQNGQQVNIGMITTFVLQPGANEICAMYETPECPQGVFWCQNYPFNPGGGCLDGIAVEAIDCNSFIFSIQGADSPDADVSWMFGDGQSQTGGGIVADHSYEVNGTYTVTAIYYGSECPQTLVTTTVTVTCGETSNCPTEMVYEQTSCGHYTFSIPGASAESTVFWNINNNMVTNNGQPISMEFAPGTYQGYAIYQAVGCAPTTFVVNFTVEPCNPGCPSEILVSDVNGCGLYGFHLIGFPQFGDITWTWGNGGSNMGANGVFHNFAPGSYEVCVAASTDACPQGVEICIPLVVEGCDMECPGGIEVVQLGCGLYGFELGSASSVVGGLWTFGDGTFQEGGYYVTHQYTEPGVYVVAVNASLVFPCFNNYFTVTVEVGECEEECHDVLITLQPTGSPSSWWISDPDGEAFYESSCEGSLCSSELCLEEGCYLIYHVPNIGGDNVFQAFSQTIDVSVELLYLGDATNIYLLSVGADCSADCYFNISGTTTNGIDYAFSASPGSFEPQYWILPNGTMWQAGSVEYAFTEPGIYEICAYYFNQECGQLVDCMTIVIQGKDCTPIGFSLTSDYMQGGPLQALWSLTGNGDGYEGFASLTPNTPVFNWTDCFPDGCYTLNITGQNMQNPEAFDIAFTGGWEVLSVVIEQDGGQFFYTFQLSLNNDCGQEPDCYYGGLAITSEIMDGGPMFTSWSISDEDEQLLFSGEYQFNPNGPSIFFYECLPSGCYTLSVTGFNYQNVNAFQVLLMGDWIQQSVEVVTGESVITYTVQFSVGEGCPEEPECFLEIQAETGDGFHFVFSATENSTVQPMGWILPGNLFVEGPVVENVFTVPGTYEVCAVYDGPDCGVVECITVEVVGEEDCFLTTVAISAEFSAIELQVLMWYLESEGFEMEGEIVLTSLNANVSFTACLPQDCYELTFEAPGGILNALAASVIVSVNGELVSISDWPSNSGVYTIVFGVNEECGENVSEQTAGASVSVYPNPSEGRFTVAGAPVGAMAQVLDAAGRLVHTFRVESPSAEIDLGNLAGGMYYLRLLNNDQVIATEKLSVMK